MAYGDLGPGLSRCLKEIGATLAQRYIIRGIVRAIDRGGWALEGAAFRRALAIELPRAEATLRLHGQVGQPFPALLQSICRAAKSAGEEVLGQLPGDGTLLSMRRAVDRVHLEIVHAGGTTAASRAAAQSIANQLVSHLSSIDGVIRQVFAKAWNLEYAGVLDLPLLNQAIAQVAGRMVEEGRFPQNLRDDLQRNLRKRRDAEFVFSTLIPERSKYQVACIVEGASTLKDIESLLPGSRTVRLGGVEPGGWGLGTNGLREFFRKHRSRRRACLALVELEASDKGSAVTRGRRVVGELLDQYIAADRLLDLRLGDFSLVNPVGRAESDEFSVRDKGVAQAYPLSKDWPRELREAMRMAHLARSTEPPLAKAALSWVALEACGIQRRKSGELARALSLQAFRQYVIRTCEEFRDAVSAERDLRVRTVAMCSAEITRSMNSLTHIPPHLTDRRNLLEQKIRRAEVDRRAAQREVNEFELTVMPYYLKVDSFAGARTDDGRYLADLDLWLTLLNSADPDEDSLIAAVRAALAETLQRFSHPAAANLENLSHQLVDPTRCAHWIESATECMQSTLDTLYTVRNLTFHNGIFAHHGDSSLGRAGVMTIDMTLEFLANWRKAEMVQVAQPRWIRSPLQIVEKLALRQQVIMAKLKSAPHARRFNIKHLTGPVTDGWDR